MLPSLKEIESDKNKLMLILFSCLSGLSGSILLNGGQFGGLWIFLSSYLNFQFLRSDILWY